MAKEKLPITKCKCGKEKLRVAGIFRCEVCNPQYFVGITPQVLEAMRNPKPVETIPPHFQRKLDEAAAER